MCGDGDFLFVHWFSSVDHAVLEDYGCVSEYEVYGSVDVTFFVELTLGVDVEGVLVAFESAAVEDGEVGPGSDCYCLVILGSGCVAECYSACYESFACYGWNWIQ